MNTEIFRSDRAPIKTGYTEQVRDDYCHSPSFASALIYAEPDCSSEQSDGEKHVCTEAQIYDRKAETPYRIGYEYGLTSERSAAPDRANR